MSKFQIARTTTWQNALALPPLEQAAAVGQSRLYGPPIRYTGRSSTAFRLSDHKGVWRNQGGW